MSLDIHALNYANAGDWSTKFGCHVAAYFYQVSLDGHGETISFLDEDGESCIRFDVSDEERAALGIKWTEAFLYEDNEGFVTAQAFEG
jgi:hypothetical protein